MKFDHMKRWQWWVSIAVLSPLIVITIVCKITSEILVLISSVSGLINPSKWKASKRIKKIVNWGLGVE